MSSALTTSAAPTPQPSILRLPSEVRQTIFRHLFADSEVVIGDKYDGEVWKVHQSLEVAVLLSCKQLCLEAQGPLASLTRLVIADQDYCTSHIFTPVFLTYVPRIEHLTLYLGRCKLATTFDARAMPALKVLHLRRAHEVDSSMEYQPEDLHIDQWDDFYEGREDKFVINKWRRWVEFEYKRGPSESSGGVRWLQRLASKPCGSPFSIMVQYSCRVDFQKAGDFGQTRYMIMVSHH